MTRNKKEIIIKNRLNAIYFKARGEWIPQQPFPAKVWCCSICGDIVEFTYCTNYCLYAYCPFCGNRNK